MHFEKRHNFPSEQFASARKDLILVEIFRAKAHQDANRKYFDHKGPICKDLNRNNLKLIELIRCRGGVNNLVFIGHGSLICERVLVGGEWKVDKMTERGN